LRRQVAQLDADRDPGGGPLAMARLTRADRDDDPVRHKRARQSVIHDEGVISGLTRIIRLMRVLVDRIGRWLPQGYGDAGRQLGLFVLAELSYEAVRGIADGERAQAFINGANVISLEKSLHTFFEPGLQSIFINHRWIVDFANFMYMNS